MTDAAQRGQLVLSILGCFGAGSLYGWSGYLPAVRAEFAISNAAASMVFSLALVSFTFGVLLGPILLARVPPRLRLPVISALAAIGLCAAGASTGFWSFAIAYGGAFGFASGVLYNYALSMAANSEAPTFLVPVSVAAFGLGGAVFGPVHMWLTEFGWGLWSFAPSLAFLGGVASAALLLRPVSKPNAAKSSTPLTVVKPDKTIAVLWLILAAGSCSGLIVLGFAAQFLGQASDGIGLASLAIFLAAIGNTLGRLSSALTVGWFGPARGMAGALILSMITLSGLVFTTAPSAMVGLLFLVAFAYGQVAATTPLLVKSQVSADAFSGAFGWVFTGWGAAGLLGPWTAGWLLDATGSLQMSLIICIALAMFSLVLVLRFTKRNTAQEQC